MSTATHIHRFTIFVGEKRSSLAIQRNVTWQDRALASKTLHEALEACHFGRNFRIVNLYDDHGHIRKDTLTQLWRGHQCDYAIIGMGKKVQAVLASKRIPHLPLIHPAARGAIRKQALYHAHVADVLKPILDDPQSYVCIVDDLRHG
jgi:hypothetical protein